MGMVCKMEWWLSASPQSWELLLAPSNDLEELYLATTRGIPHLDVCPQHLPQSFALSCGQCTTALPRVPPGVAGYLLLTISCLSHICTLIYSVLIRIQELKKKKISNISSSVRNTACVL